LTAQGHVTRFTAISAPIPKFAKLWGSMDATFGTIGTLANIGCWCRLDLKFLFGPAGAAIGTSNPPHEWQKSA